ncbi:MAG: amidohydrolase family protein [Gemmatimonadota bacterium]
MQRCAPLLTALIFVVAAAGCSAPRDAAYDVLIRGGTMYDGSGDAPFVADLAISGDTIAAIGDLAGSTATLEVDATGYAVAPGFINMLSWATEDLLVDGRSLGDLRQGVTLEVFGEGESMGPINEDMRAAMLAGQGDLRFEVPWTTLGEYMEYMVARGIATNVASFIGATTVRIHELGYEDRAPTVEELARMQELVREAMREGALGVGSSLIYPPAFYADTEELIALASAAGEFGGGYISHMRSEGNQLLEAIEELITIAREAGVRAEIYHLKAAGNDNWGKLDAVIERVERARAEGLEITADMYNYTAGSTGLDASMPPWVAEGGQAAMIERLRDPATRARLAAEMSTPTDEWENLLLSAGSPERVLLVGFRQDSLKYLTGRTLADVAEMRGTSVEETAMDLVVQDDSRVGTVYFMMDEDNVRRQIALPWVSFGSDGGSKAPEEPFTLSNTHPRAYGNVPRLLGRYVREEGIITLEEAIRKLTSLPAANLRLDRRGSLSPGGFADVVIFDPTTIQDHATFEDPHQLSEGVRDVFVNGVAVLRDGDPTGAMPGQVVRGPGWTR